MALVETGSAMEDVMILSGRCFPETCGGERRQFRVRVVAPCVLPDPEDVDDLSSDGSVSLDGDPVVEDALDTLVAPPGAGSPISNTLRSPSLSSFEDEESTIHDDDESDSAYGSPCEHSSNQGSSDDEDIGDYVSDKLPPACGQFHKDRPFYKGGMCRECFLTHKRQRLIAADTANKWRGVGVGNILKKARDRASNSTRGSEHDSSDEIEGDEALGEVDADKFTVVNAKKKTRIKSKKKITSDEMSRPEPTPAGPKIQKRLVRKNGGKTYVGSLETTNISRLPGVGSDGLGTTQQGQQDVGETGKRVGRSPIKKTETKVIEKSRGITENSLREKAERVKATAIQKDLACKRTQKEVPETKGLESANSSSKDFMIPKKKKSVSTGGVSLSIHSVSKEVKERKNKSHHQSTRKFAKVANYTYGVVREIRDDDIPGKYYVRIQKKIQDGPFGTAMEAAKRHDELAMYGGGKYGARLNFSGAHTAPESSDPDITGLTALKPTTSTGEGGRLGKRSLKSAYAQSSAEDVRKPSKPAFFAPREVDPCVAPSELSLPLVPWATVITKEYDSQPMVHVSSATTTVPVQSALKRTTTKSILKASFHENPQRAEPCSMPPYVCQGAGIKTDRTVNVDVGGTSHAVQGSEDLGEGQRHVQDTKIQEREHQGDTRYAYAVSTQEGNIVDGMSVNRTWSGYEAVSGVNIGSGKLESPAHGEHSLNATMSLHFPDCNTKQPPTSLRIQHVPPTFECASGELPSKHETNSTGDCSSGPSLHGVVESIGEVFEGDREIRREDTTNLAQGIAKSMQESTPLESTEDSLMQSTSVSTGHLGKLPQTIPWVRPTKAWVRPKPFATAPRTAFRSTHKPWTDSPTTPVWSRNVSSRNPEIWDRPPGTKLSDRRQRHGERRDDSITPESREKTHHYRPKTLSSLEREDRHYHGDYTARQEERSEEQGRHGMLEYERLKNKYNYSWEYDDFRGPTHDTHDTHDGGRGDRGRVGYEHPDRYYHDRLHSRTRGSRSDWGSERGSSTYERSRDRYATCDLREPLDRSARGLDWVSSSRRTEGYNKDSGSSRRFSRSRSR